MASNTSGSKPNPFELFNKTKAGSNPFNNSGPSAEFQNLPKAAVNPFTRNHFGKGFGTRTNLLDNVGAIGANNAAQAWPRVMPDGSMSLFGSPSNLVIKQAAPIHGLAPLKDVTVPIPDDEEEKEEDREKGYKAGSES